MSDIPIYNETGYELTPLMHEHIRSETLEHFGEKVTAIWLKLDILRHAFNIKTGEVRFAFSPFDYGLSEPALSPAGAVAPYIHIANPPADAGDHLLSDYVGDEGRDTFAVLDDILEIPDGDEKIVLEDFDEDYYAIETGDPDTFSTGGTEIDPY